MKAQKNRRVNSQVADKGKKDRVAGLAERDAAEQVEILKAALDRVEEIVWYKDAENHVVWGNRTALASSGVTLEDVVGRSMEELSPREAQRYWATDRQVVETGKPVLGIDQVLRELSGRRFPVRTDKFPHFDRDGNVVGIVAVSRDASMESKAERALHITEKHYRRFNESSPLGVCKADSAGQAFLVDDRWCEICGLSAEQCLGLGWMAAVHPSDREILRKDWLRIVSQGRPWFRARFSVKEVTGKMLPVALQAVAEQDARGAVTSYTLTLAVIPWEEVADSPSREQREFFDSLASVAPVGIFHFDRGGRCTYMNDRGLEILDLAWEKAMGLGWTDAVHPDDRERLYRAVPREMQSKRRIRTDCRVVCADGGVRWVIGLAIPRLGDDGEVMGYVGTMTDVSQQVEAQLQVQELNNQLEQRVLDRTAELQAANEELESFCYCVSHDLRSPLRILDGFSFTILEDYADNLDEEGAGRLRRIRAASQRMGRLIDDLLTMSRLNRGAVKRELVDLSSVVESLVNEFRHSSPDREVKVKIAQGVRATCDPTLTRVLLQNLIENAWKFTRRNEEAHIEFGRRDSPDDGVDVYFVRDDGVGFDMAYSDKLFSAFERLHDAVEFEGSGIGLATVDRIVNRHGGKVWLESRVGYGTTVYFTVEGSGGH